MLWWLIGCIVALPVLVFLWGAISFMFLKLYYRNMHE